MPFITNSIDKNMLESPKPSKTIPISSHYCKRDGLTSHSGKFSKDLQ